MKSENEKVIKKEDVKILKVKKAKRKTPEQIEEEKRLKAAKKAAERSKQRAEGEPKPKKPRNKKTDPKSGSEQLKLETAGLDTSVPNDGTATMGSGETAYEIEVNAPQEANAPSIDADIDAPIPKTAKKIVFLCTGNTCRSPMAEFIFKATASKYGRSDEYEVSSAGLGADGGVGLAENSAFALASLGIPFTNRKSVQMSIRAAREADLIICMTQSHKQAMSGLPNCVTLAELCSCGDIPDPYGQSKETYVETAKVLINAIESLFK